MHECIRIFGTHTLKHRVPAAAAALKVHQSCESSSGKLQAASEDRETGKTAAVTQVPGPYHSTDMGPAISVYFHMTLRI